MKLLAEEASVLLAFTQSNPEPLLNSFSTVPKPHTPNLGAHFSQWGEKKTNGNRRQQRCRTRLLQKDVNKLSSKESTCSPSSLAKAQLNEKVPGALTQLS